MRWITMPAVIALAAAMALPAAQAQHHGMDMGKAETTPQGPYSPRLGDIMILQQIRHSKLWFAAAREQLGAGRPRARRADGSIRGCGEAVSDGWRGVRRARDQRAQGAGNRGARPGHHGARPRQVRGRLRQADRRLQCLPSGHQARLHRHPAADLAALQQPVVHAGTARSDGGARPRALRDQVE